MMRKEIPRWNRNHTGWWIASYIERFEFYDEDKLNANRRCLAWENTILIKAEDREEAYQKAVDCARLSEGCEAQNDSGRTGVWRYEGLTSLLPVYEELEDGAEILWVEHAGKTVRKIQSRVKMKNELEAFDDNES